MSGPHAAERRLAAEVDWVDGAPVSSRFGDIYFSRADGLAESREVFLKGCGLPDAWRGRDRFTVAELGFGTGLNIAALLELWRRTREPGAHLSIFSVEGFPLSLGDATQALSTWREFAEVASVLLAAWPTGRLGLHRISLPGFSATLDLYVGEVEAALSAWSGSADAWFLDGFAPARNPQMWSEPVLEAVGRLSAPGASAATFTVAGRIRRALGAAGFEVAKRPGHGAKRERLEARLPGCLRRHSSPRRVLVVGGGIAGAALVRAFAQFDVACVLIEAEGLGAGASGNPAALVTPRLDAGFGPAAQLHAQAFHRAIDLYRRETPGAVIAEGALQLAASPSDKARFDRIAAWGGFDPASLKPLDDLCTATLLAETLPGAGDDARAAGGLHLCQALVVHPAKILSAWLGGAERVTGRVAGIEASPTGWCCVDAQGREIARGDAICIATGLQTAQIASLSGLQAVRGQLEYVEAPVFDGLAAAWGAYAIPLADGGALFGASHRRGDADTSFRAEERAANLSNLAIHRPQLAGRVEASAPGALRSRVAVRAATPDHLPLAGVVQPGLGVLTGLGGRGFTLAPLLAEHVAATLMAVPSPLPVTVADRLRPSRFSQAKPKPVAAV